MLSVSACLESVDGVRHIVERRVGSSRVRLELCPSGLWWCSIFCADIHGAPTGVGYWAMGNSSQQAAALALWRLYRRSERAVPSWIDGACVLREEAAARARRAAACV